MKRRHLLMLLLLGVPLVAAAAPSTVIYPPQELAISYSHVLHAQRGAVDCSLCHKGVAKSMNAADRLMPEERDCEGAGCHTIERALAQGCNECHPGYTGEGTPAAVVIPAPNLKFPHALHPGSCASCHGDPEARNVGMMTRADLPLMASCATCHDGKTAPARCTTCHAAAAAGRMRTSYPAGVLVPEATHPVDVRTNHGKDARADERSCANCHAKQECLTCHDGRQKPMDFHAGDYQMTHAIDARRNTPNCSSCHRAQTFCTGCHARAGVTADKRTSAYDASKGVVFHPTDWHSDQREHAAYARRNLRACASCHREDFCMTCHASGVTGATVAVNPHGAGWKASRRCTSLEDKNPRLCLRCHVQGRTCDE